MGGVYLTRGLIKNAARKQQINDFSGLLIGNITPTDLDGVTEYKDKAYMLFEVKYDDAELPYGQRLCIERMIKDFGKSGKQAIAVVVEHDVHDTNESVSVAQCRVREIYMSHEKIWRPPKKFITAGELQTEYLLFINREIAV